MKRQTLLRIGELDIPNFLAERANAALFGRKAFAGIGSREVEKMPSMKRLMIRISERLADLDWILRSGRARGADRAFERGAKRKEIFLPWFGFGSDFVFDPAISPSFVRSEPSAKALEIASGFHPRWDSLSRSERLLHARNSHQILGAACNDPSAFVICWTPDGSIGKTTSKTGGTGQAIRIAHVHGIQIFNLQRDDHREAWERFIGVR